ncbi:MAG: serine/threonine protein kinase [Nannocystaceae bacterium]|nr:serine/threonine protein kinase [Nannocystaceae bacterium]
MTTPASGGEEDPLADLEVERALASFAGSPQSAPEGVLQALQSLLQRANTPSIADTRYTLLRELGRGGMGVVWLAHDEKLDRDVAVKRLASEVSTSLARLHREARTIARIAHDNVVEVFDISLQTHPAYIVMEYVDGRTLRAHLKHSGPLGWRAIVQLYQQAADGLRAAHALGLVHRDFKPDNAMVDAAGVVKVLDFGLTTAPAGESRVSSDGDLEVSEEPITRTAVWLGTPAYMSPQQHQGLPADPSDDIYALGVCLWESLYGERPFRAPTLDALAREKRRGATPQPRASDVPDRVHQVVARALQPNRESRWQSVDELSRALQGAERSSSSTRRWLAGVAIMGGAAVATVALQEEDPCKAPIQAVQIQWDEQRSSVSEKPAQRALDAYVVDWSQRYAAACNEGDRREHRDVRHCLQGELSQVFTGSAWRRDTKEIPTGERCADPELARLDWPHPEHGEAVLRLESYAQRNLATAVVGGSLGTELAANLDRARATEHGPTLAMLLYLTALTDKTRSLEQRQQLLEEAIERSDASGADRLAMRCAAMLAEVLYRREASADAIAGWIDYAYSREERLDRLDEAQLAVANAHALILSETGRPWEALEVAEDALDWAGDGAWGPLATRLIGRTASALTSMGRHRAAAEQQILLAKDGWARKVSPELMVERLGNVGVSLQRAGEDDAAIEYFEEQLVILQSITTPFDDRGFHEVNIARGLGLRPRTRATAVAMLRGVVERTPIGTDLHARAAYSLGGVLDEQGELTAAAVANRTARVSVELVFGPDSPHADDVSARIAALGSP